MDQTQEDILHLIKTHVDLFGQDVALRAIKNVPGLQLNTDGTIKKISGDERAVLLAVIRGYYAVSGYLSQQIIRSERIF